MKYRRATANLRVVRMSRMIRVIGIWVLLWLLRRLLCVRHRLNGFLIEKRVLVGGMCVSLSFVMTFVRSFCRKDGFGAGVHLYTFSTGCEVMS